MHCPYFVTTLLPMVEENIKYVHLQKKFIAASCDSHTCEFPCQDMERLVLISDLIERVRRIINYLSQRWADGRAAATVLMRYSSQCYGAASSDYLVTTSFLNISCSLLRGLADASWVLGGSSIQFMLNFGFNDVTKIFIDGLFLLTKLYSSELFSVLRNEVQLLYRGALVSKSVARRDLDFHYMANFFHDKFTKSYKFIVIFSVPETYKNCWNSRWTIRINSFGESKIYFRIQPFTGNTTSVSMGHRRSQGIFCVHSSHG